MKRIGSALTRKTPRDTRYGDSSRSRGVPAERFKGPQQAKLAPRDSMLFAPPLSLPPPFLGPASLGKNMHPAQFACDLALKIGREKGMEGHKEIWPRADAGRLASVVP